MVWGVRKKIGAGAPHTNTVDPPSLVYPPISTLIISTLMIPTLTVLALTISTLTASGA
jgi:hypothetical protein